MELFNPGTCFLIFEPLLGLTGNAPDSSLTEGAGALPVLVIPTFEILVDIFSPYSESLTDFLVLFFFVTGLGSALTPLHLLQNIGYE